MDDLERATVTSGRSRLARLRRARPDRHDVDRPGPVDRLVMRAPAIFRRRLFAGAVLAVLVLAGVTSALAWRQYTDNKHRAVGDLNARVVLVGAVVNTTFTGAISTLDSISAASAVVRGTPAVEAAYLRRARREGGQLFTGGLAQLDLLGNIAASSKLVLPENLSDRMYFKRVIATREPFISPGLIGRQLKQPIVIVAVPTFGRQHRLSGVLTGSILLSTIGESDQIESLGFKGLTIVDREGQLLLGGLARVRDTALLRQIEKTASGDVKNTRGLEGGRHHLVAFANSSIPRWTIAIDRSESDVYAVALRSLVLELASLGAAVALVLLILVLIMRRSRQELEAQSELARAWSRLTRTLAVAATPADVADALLESVEAVFPDAVVVVSVDSGSGPEIRAESALPGWRHVARDVERIKGIAALASGQPRTRSLERERPLRQLYRAFGRRLKAVHNLPIVDESGAMVGSISVASDRTLLSPGEWELLGAFAEQASRSLGRARAFEHDHEVALRLQQSLLPHRLPSAPGIGLAGEYVAAGAGVEVGGDWYDAVRRPDGIVQLCVGDVSGRGIGAATVMGRQRNVFHAYAYDFVSPADILRRMLRHVSEDEMITAACVSIDPVAGELAYSRAGHPPPLLLDQEAGEVVRLDGAGAPPLGVADPGDLIEEHLPLPEHARLAMYTDGLVERRGENIDDGIDVLAHTLATGANVTAEDALAAITRTIGAPTDDVALLVAAVDPVVAFEFELGSDPTVLPELRRRLRAWLERRGFGEEETAEVVLAVSEGFNNAIEHAYEGALGTVRLSGRVDGDRLTIEIEDKGRWQVSEPNDERGWGIMLMETLMHSVEVDSTAHGTRLRLERRRSVLAGREK
jgi:anti-sigma regulatory factor (Ser/Thr protein kinase)